MGFTRHCRDAILSKSHNPHVPTKMKNRVRYAVFAFLVEVRGFVANTVCVIASVQIYLQSEASTQNKCALRLCVTHDTACPICLLCPLRSMSANAPRLPLSSLAVSPKYGVRVAKQRHDEIVQSPHDKHKKTS